jgi:hypothetical protein
VVEKALDLDEETKSGIEQIVKEYESYSELGDRETLIADSRLPLYRRRHLRRSSKMPARG